MSFRFFKGVYRVASRIDESYGVDKIYNCLGSVPGIARVSCYDCCDSFVVLLVDRCLAERACASMWLARSTLYDWTWSLSSYWLNSLLGDALKMDYDDV